MNNLFAVETMNYDQNNDLVIAKVYLKRSSISTEDTSAENSLERFELYADFANRTFSITDLGDFQSDVEPHYEPSVLTAFLRKFDVENLEPFEFEVPV